MARTRGFAPDLAASLVVFLVALPLSLGIAMASGAPPGAGILSAAIGGIMVGLLAGAPLQVSGPAAGLVVIVLQSIESQGFAATCVATALAGAMQLGLAGLGAARWIRAIPPGVLHGMLAGIGVSIVTGQLQVATGGLPHGSALENVAGLLTRVDSWDLTAAAITGLVIVVMVSWDRLRPVRWLPGALIALVTATIVARELSELVRSSAFDLRPHFAPPLDVNLLDGQIWVTAMMLALVASAESLLCAVALDRMHDGARARLDRELAAQGVGNLLAGALGGLPITGVVVRSSANLAAGARTRVSAILHGVWILGAGLLLADVMSSIPTAAFAGVLIVIGTRLLRWHDIVHLARAGELWPYLATLLGAVTLGLLGGIAVGLVLAVVLRRSGEGRGSIDVVSGGRQARVNLAGTLTFFDVPRVLDTLRTVDAEAEVVVDLRHAQVDLAVAQALDDGLSAHRLAGRLRHAQ